MDPAAISARGAFRVRLTNASACPVVTPEVAEIKYCLRLYSGGMPNLERSPMIKLHVWPTPNGYKVLIFLEEAGIPYEITPVNINKGDQFKPDFLAISPNNRMPAIIDDEPKGGGTPISMFESGAILLYLADKSGKFLGLDTRGRFEAVQWLFWQMAGLGPIAGQNHHFVGYAPEKLTYAIERFVNETGRLYAVLNRQLHGREFIAGFFSIADMACYPWILLHERQKQDLANFPNVRAWLERIRDRPAVVRAYEVGRSITTNPSASTDEERALLFNQSAQTLQC